MFSGAPNGAAALQKIAMSPVVVIAKGYAIAATLAEHGKVPNLAAYDSGNLLSAAISNPGREKALDLAAAEAVAGIAIFPNFSTEQRSRG